MTELSLTQQRKYKLEQVANIGGLIKRLQCRSVDRLCVYGYGIEQVTCSGAHISALAVIINTAGRQTR